MEALRNLPLFLSVKKASELSGISRWTLYRLCTEGTLKSKKVGRLRLIQSESLLELLGLTKGSKNERQTR